MVELRKSIQVKFAPESEELKTYFKEYAEIVNYGLAFTSNVYLQYQKLPEEEGTCPRCQKQTNITYEHKKSGERICTPCFRRAYGEYTLRPALIDQLRETYPDFSVYGSHYNAPLRHIFGIFKSYVKKLEERQKDLEKIQAELKEAIQNGEADFSTTWKQGQPNTTQQLQIDWYPNKLKQLKKLQNPISFPNFQGSTIRFWKGFAGVEEDLDEGINIWVKDLKTKKSKHSYSGKYGDYQLKHITEMTDKLADKYYSIHLKDGKYYLDVPYVKDINLPQDEEILKLKPKNIAVAVFGVKEPLTVYIFKNNKLKETKQFGDESFWETKNKKTELNKKVIAKIRKRHEGDKAKIRKQIKKWWNKVRNSQSRWITDYLNNMTYQAAEYIKNNNIEVTLMRNTKGFSKLNYPPSLNKTLHAWPLTETQTMLEYKLCFREIPTYKIRHKEVSDITCECGKKHKTLTLKLKGDPNPTCECGKTINLYTSDANNIIETFNEKNN